MIFNKNDRPYNLKTINSIKKAKAMDLVLALCMNSYVNQDSKLDFYKVEERLCDDLGFHSWESEFLLDIMKDMGYIKEEYGQNKVVERIYCKPRGVKMYINGGFELKAKRKRRERRLLGAGQFLSLIIGFYYTFLLLKIMKETLGVTGESLMNWLNVLTDF